MGVKERVLSWLSFNVIEIFEHASETTKCCCE